MVVGRRLDGGGDGGEPARGRQCGAGGEESRPGRGGKYKGTTRHLRDDETALAIDALQDLCTHPKAGVNGNPKSPKMEQSTPYTSDQSCRPAHQAARPGTRVCRAAPPGQDPPRGPRRPVPVQPAVDVPAEAEAVTWSLVERGLRGQGLAAIALRGAVELMAQAGGGLVEGYPHDTGGVRKKNSSFLYNGTHTMYEREGFTYDRPKGQGNCVMVREVAPSTRD